MTYQYNFLKNLHNEVVAITEISNDYTKKHWKLNSLITIKTFKTTRELDMSFLRTQKWLKENYPELFI